MLLSGMVKVDGLKWASLHGQQWSRSVSQSVENSICVYMYEDVWMKTIRGFAWTWVNTHTHTHTQGICGLMVLRSPFHCCLFFPPLFSFRICRREPESKPL